MEKEEVEGQLAQLAQQLNCMGTEDEETLVRNFQQLLAPHADLSQDYCRFFLDMNNWNLQEALGSFYDYNAQQMIFQSLPAMQFVADVTVGEGESVPPNSRFVKTWRIRNSGADQWSVGCCLRHIEGDLLAEIDHVDVGALKPGEVTDVSLTMTSPAKQGVCQSRWRMFTGAGLPFGETIWCIIIVDDGGLLDLTQRLASTSCGTSQEAQMPAEWLFAAGGVGPPYHGDANREEPKGACLKRKPNPFQSEFRLCNVSQLRPRINFDGQWPWPGKNDQQSFESAPVSDRAESTCLATSLRSRTDPPPMAAENAHVSTESFCFGSPTRLPDTSTMLTPFGECSRAWRGWDEKAVENPAMQAPANNVDSSAEIGALEKSKLSYSSVSTSSTNMGAVSVVQPLQPLYGSSSSTDDDMEN